MAAYGTAGIPAARTVRRHMTALGARWLERPAPGDDDIVRLVRRASPAPLVARMSWGTEPMGEDFVQAICGVMAVHGRRDGHPRRLGVDIASAAAGVLTVTGLLAAELSRMRGRAIATVDVTVAQAALLLVGQHLAVATTPRDDDDDVVDTEPGIPPPYWSSDGVLFELDTLDAESWRRFWFELGAEPADISRGWRPFMLRYATAVSPLPQGLHACVRRYPYSALREIADRHTVSITKVRGAADWRQESLVAGPVQPWDIQAIGEPLSDLPSGDSPPQEAGPLSGITVVESTRRVQGPLAGMILKLLGARVIRVEPAGGDLLRGMPPTVNGCSSRFLALNRGKEVVEVDLKTAAGRAEMLDLLAGADVFLHNWSPVKAPLLRLEPAHVADVNPRIVYAHASGWGGLFSTPTPIGTDFMVQAYTGVGELVEPAGHEPRPSLMTIVDSMGGIVAAEGVLAGLVMRQRTGRAQRVGTSLLSAANVLLAEAPSGPPDWSELDEPFATATGHLYVRALGDTRAELARIVGRGTEPGRIAAGFREAPAEEWLSTLTSAGLSCTSVPSDISSVSDDPRLRDYLTRDVCTFVRPPWRFQ